MSKQSGKVIKKRRLDKWNTNGIFNPVSSKADTIFQNYVLISIICQINQNSIICGNLTR